MGHDGYIESGVFCIYIWDYNSESKSFRLSKVEHGPHSSCSPVFIFATVENRSFLCCVF